ncbi:MAG TPA: hypothetical protein PLL94_02615 [Bacteroidales bacterium]|nr:hypothetical protein [Bacteroidales bacterium]
MRDFTIKTYHLLLSALKDNGYLFQTFRDFIKNPASGCVILRHDVDARKMNSLNTARIENELGIAGTYYFRIVPESYDESVIREIAGMGHEVGYHYEDVSLMAQRYNGATAQRRKDNKDEELLAEIAIESFKQNLEKIRKIVPVETICMHGSPLSRWDNRLLWKYYDYRDFGIVGEPYFDTDFDEVLYLTDTGRRWDGRAVAIRDKAEGGWRMAEGERKMAEVDSPSAFSLQPSARLHSSFDIINAAMENSLPDKIMLTVHPQRWDDQVLPWVRELVWQNVKNVIKGVVAGKMKR